MVPSGSLYSHLRSIQYYSFLFANRAIIISAVEILGARMLRKVFWLVPLSTVMANTVIVPFVLAYAYHMEGGLPFLMLTVGVGEILSAYVLGMVLLLALKKYERFLWVE